MPCYYYTYVEPASKVGDFSWVVTEVHPLDRMIYSDEVEAVLFWKKISKKVAKRMVKRYPDTGEVTDE